MPTYSFKCNQCETEFDELFQRIPRTDNFYVDCPNCGAQLKSKETRIIKNVGAVHYKGKGFFTTDYKGTRAHNEAN